MHHLYLDIESRSELAVEDVGAEAYAEHPSTEVLCCAFAFDDGPVSVVRGDDLHRLRLPEDAVLVAHNVGFERSVLPRRWPQFQGRRWRDTASCAARMSLPRNLEELAAYLFPDKPEYQKDMAGNRAMLKLCQPRRYGKKVLAEAKAKGVILPRWWTPETAPEDFAKLYAYCGQDVEVMRACDRKILPLEPQEQRIWELTEKMNARGVKVDTAALPVAMAHLEEHSRALTEEFVGLVGHPVKSYVKVAQALAMPDVRKPTVRKALRDPKLPARTKRALEIFSQLSESASAKLVAMRDRICQDGRLRGALVYAGAERTARWSSWGVQLQNMKRGLGELTDAAFEALVLGVLVELFVGLPMQHPTPPLNAVGMIGELVRGFLVGPFIVGDLAQIEARVLLWLAGQEDQLRVFREKSDLYCLMATKIYGRPITKKDKAERFLGKTAVLGAGYGLGHKGFLNQLDETYDVQIEPELAKKIIKTYRAANPQVVKLWSLLERAFVHVTLHKSKRVAVGKLFMGTSEIGGVGYTWIELPSGRKMYYAGACVHHGEPRYFGRNQYKGGVWEIVPTYGGKLAENVTQAVARDVIAEGMLRLDAAGFDLDLTVHDEVVADPREGKTLEEDEADFERVMVEVPAWAAGLPVEAEVFSCGRYRK